MESLIGKKKNQGEERTMAGALFSMPKFYSILLQPLPA
jgi:hypothetical protein